MIANDLMVLISYEKKLSIALVTQEVTVIIHRITKVIFFKWKTPKWFLGVFQN